MVSELTCTMCYDESDGSSTMSSPATTIYEGRALCWDHYEELSKRLAEAMLEASDR